jgi:predicted RNase H-like nuclease (RuvC/YqgF family)
MLKKHAELTEEVMRLEGVVEKQGRELEVMNSNRMGMYDDEYNSDGAVTQRMVDEEEDQVKALEEKIKEMQEQVPAVESRMPS